MKWWRKVHQWAGLMIGVQILLWISGGVVMSILPIEQVRGRHLVEVPSLPAVLPPFPAQLMAENVSQLSWKVRAGQPIVEVQTHTGDIRWHQVNGEPLDALNVQQIATLADQLYQGSGSQIRVSLIKSVVAEAKHIELPAYRVDFDDWIHTSLYLHPVSGQLMSVRSDLWRIFDFFWMLHILDFEEREDFNNPLLISASVVAWLFICTGFVLLYYSLLKPRFKRWRYKRTKS